MTLIQSQCKHGKYVFETRTNDNHYSGETETETVRLWESFEEDISISQYQCSACGLIFNYSGGNPSHKIIEG